MNNERYFFRFGAMIGVREIECFRRRYVKQAVVVFVVLSGAAFGLSTLVLFFLGRVFIWLLAAAIFYRMFYALREDLQVRGEGIILAKGGGEVLGGAVFSVGDGIDENVLLGLEGCPKYQARECLNVIKGEGFCLEEDWLYMVFSARGIPFYQTTFEGVVLAVDCFDDEAAEEGSGNIRLFKGRAVTEGRLRFVLDKAGVGVTKLMKMFEISEIKAEKKGGKVYFWIGGGKKILTQFSLFKTNTAGRFIKRAGEVCDVCRQIASALREENGDKA